MRGSVPSLSERFRAIANLPIVECRFSGHLSRVRFASVPRGLRLPMQNVRGSKPEESV